MQEVSHAFCSFVVWVQLCPVDHVGCLYHSIHIRGGMNAGVNSADEDKPGGRLTEKCIVRQTDVNIWRGEATKEVRKFWVSRFFFVTHALLQNMIKHGVFKMYTLDRLHHFKKGARKNKDYFFGCSCMSIAFCAGFASSAFAETRCSMILNLGS